MPRIAPFGSLVFDGAVAGSLSDLTARPYDVISETGSLDYRSRSPYNIVHLDLAPERGTPSDQRYVSASERLRSWIDAGALTRRAPAWIAYEMSTADDRLDGPIRGVFCALALEPWGGSILPHEDVMPGPVQDRLDLLRTTRTHLSAIYGTVPGPHAELAALLEQTMRAEPDAEIVDQENVRHRTWTIPAIQPIDRWLADDHLLIADGHHRYTTALLYRDERHATDGHGPWDHVLALIVDAGTQEIPVLPYHRLQAHGPVPRGGTSVAGLDALLEGVDDARSRFGLVKAGPTGPGFTLHDLRGEPPTVRALHAEHLDTTAVGSGLTFTHEALEAVRAVHVGRAIAAYVLPPTTPDRIMKVVEAGERLPRKSTFFWPKPRTGLVMMPLEPT